VFTPIGGISYTLNTDGTSIWAVNATEQMRLTSTGLGIGTSSPTYKLDISVTTNNGIRTTSSAGQQLYLGNTGGEGVVGTLNNYAFNLMSNGSLRFQIGTSGQLGIGGATYGTAGQVLTSGGSGAAPTWETAGGGANLQEFTSSGTWTKPSGATFVMVETWGAGGGGGSGRNDITNSDRQGGTGGGGGAYAYRLFKASSLASTVTVTIGASGTGGASVTTSPTNGNDGGVGGTTSYGALLYAYGGIGGLGGTSASSSLAGGTGGGVLTSGEPYHKNSGTFGTGFSGGLSIATASGAANPSGFGGGAGGVTSGTGSRYAGGSSYQGGAGGGAGATFYGGDKAATAGGANINASGGGGAAGVSSAVTATAGAAGTTFGFGGGGGGGGLVSVSGAAGGAGGIAGGGGGGGMGCNTSGAGGAGGAGFCRVYSW
jgi:hypothetical protein